MSHKVITVTVTSLLLAVLVSPSTGQRRAPRTPPRKGGEAKAQEVQPAPQKIERHSFFDSTAKWRSPNIYVCWENPEPRFQGEMDLVRRAVASTWEAASALRFQGWEKCGAENRGIRIQIDDSSPNNGPHVKALGRYLEDESTGLGVKNGMVLNFTFNRWSQACKESEERRLGCIQSIAVHEFGHAVGFAHEQNRADAPGECRKLAQGPNGNVLLTPYDPKSVMNYCNQKYNNDGRLSNCDIVAVHNEYPPEPSGAGPVQLPPCPEP